MLFKFTQQEGYHQMQLNFVDNENENEIIIKSTFRIKVCNIIIKKDQAKQYYYYYLFLYLFTVHIFKEMLKQKETPR